MSRLTALTLAILTLVLLPEAAWSVRPVVSDMTAARELCDGRPLRHVEGIWSFPQDHISVLIILNDNHRSTSADTYTLYVVESEDCRLHPGDVAGQLEETPDHKKFRLSLNTKRVGGVLSVPMDCAAFLDEEDEALTVKAPKLKVKINPLIFFSKFWRLARISVDDPTRSLPAGMLKLYPGYDGNGSLRRIPRYL